MKNDEIKKKWDELYFMYLMVSLCQLFFLSKKLINLLTV